jgi:predicted AlkP superfamily phosphohydrolase/phosphomutase
MLRGSSGEENVYWGLMIASGEQGYDRILICQKRDARTAVCELTVGQWSDWFVDTFVIDGSPVEGYVRVKLVKLSPEGDELEVFVPQVWPRTGYTQPAGIAEEIDQNVGNFLQNPARDALGRVDDDTYFELLEFHHQRLAEVALYLARSRPWDLLMVETHASDYTSHFFLGQADATSGAPPDVLERSRSGVIRTYQSIDRMIGRLRELADPETVFLVVSDHGGTSVQHPAVDINQVLQELGFLVYKDADRSSVDWAKTRAYGVGLVHVFLNVAGRDPEGIVDSDDYAKVRRELIEALTCYRDSDTGELPFSVVLSRDDAEMMNLWGDRVGDVVYALRPEFDGAHGKQLPSVSFGMGGQHSTFVMAGAGVAPKGLLTSQVRVVDVAPTVCYLTGVPMPRDAEGGVVQEALADPEG